MRSFLCKPLKLCSSVLSEVKEVPPKRQEKTSMPSLLTQLQTAREAEKSVDKKSKKKAESSTAHRNESEKGALQERVASSVLTKEQKSQSVKPHKARKRASSRRHHNAQQEFQRAMAMARGKVYTDHESLPSYENAFTFFKDMYPRYLETAAIDTLRSEEYSHLCESGRVCLDYCGFGLFSHLQQVEQWDSASFALSNISVNLCSHALFGAAEDGTVECDVRKRIMNYLNISESEYSMVFTASRGSSFKLLADAYPFETCSRLITMYDYESESVNWMVQRAKEKGAKASNVTFKLPSLRIVSTKLRKLLVARRRRRGPAKGLFIFPVQSRVTGAKYSYQWMSLAQQNKWHVLLDASAIGPKDMGSLGLSLFKPDFIVASFYKVFGGDPSGFGCLFIKNSVMQSIQDESGAPASGIVRIVPYPVQWSWSQSSEGDQAGRNELDEDAQEGQGLADFEFQGENNELTPMVASFSGPMLGFNRQSSSEEASSRLPGIEGVMEEDDDNDSSVCGSVGEVTRSPAFSDDGADTLFCIDVGRSPIGTASRTSMSEDPFSGPFSSPFSGPFSGPIHNSVYDGGTFSKSPGTTRCNPLFEHGSNAVNGVQSAGSGKKGDKQDQILGSYSYEGGALENGSEDVMANVFVSSKPSKQNVRGVELLDPGRSPLASGHHGCQQSQVFDNAFVQSIDTHENQMDSSNEIEACDSSNDLGKVKPDRKQNFKEKVTLQQTESAIRRETEGEFRLLGRRNGDRWMGGRSLSPIIQEAEELDSAEERGSYAGMDAAGEFGSTSYQDHTEAKSGDEDDWDASEPEVVCRSLDHADMLGLNKATLRLRYLINWLISSLLQLCHPGPEDNLSLVQLYGPQMKYDRGASVAFNLYDCHGSILHPELVQTLADKNGISLSIGFLRNLQAPDGTDINTYSSVNKSTHGWGEHRKGLPQRVEVVTAALSILSDFEDVYRLWVFVAKFLDADFVSKELGGQPVHLGAIAI